MKKKNPLNLNTNGLRRNKEIMLVNTLIMHLENLSLKQRKCFKHICKICLLKKKIFVIKCDNSHFSKGNTLNPHSYYLLKSKEKNINLLPN